jgi:hypothetical protein
MCSIIPQADGSPSINFSILRSIAWSGSSPYAESQEITLIPVSFPASYALLELIYKIYGTFYLATVPAFLPEYFSATLDRPFDFNSQQTTI